MRTTTETIQKLHAYVDALVAQHVTSSCTPPGPAALRIPLTVTSLCGEHLRTLREQRGLTATALATQLEMSVFLLLQIECGVCAPPSFHWILRVAQVLDLPEEHTIALALLALRHPKGVRVGIDDFRHALPVLRHLVEAFPQEPRA